MRLLRGIILPTIIAAPLWMLASRAQFPGLSDFPQLDVGDWVFGLFFTLIGLLLVGLPAAWKIQRLHIPASIKLILLVIAGAVGGGLIAFLYPLILVVLSGRHDLDSIGNLIPIGTYGFVPGAIVASVWITFNFDRLRTRSA